MARKQRQGRGSRHSRRAMRRSSACTPPSSTQDVIDVTPPSAPAAERRRRAVARAPLVAAAVVMLVGVVGVVGAVLLRPPAPDVAASPSPTMITGTAGGFVTSQGDPSAEPAAVPPSPSAVPTETPVATPASTAPALVAATPPPEPTALPASTSAAQPTAVALAVAGPDDAVGAFYAHVVAGSFDQAYSLWSERMRAAYPRQENLDQRFDETASIDFKQLFVAEQAGGSATVQANFTETYDSGSSRQFVGYWRLVQVDGRWLLDQPNY